jgi:diacylglycerol kinase (ATP)
MNTAGASLLARLWRATCFSLAGLRAAFRTQVAFRLEVSLLLGIVPAAWILAQDGAERALLIGSWMLVIVVEVLNSAIEVVIDRIGAERNELSGRAKDLGSAAVFCAIVLAGVVWTLILWG